MAKVKCKVCGNESLGLCKIKDIGVKTNKPRICEAYIYDERKLKSVPPPPVIRITYKEKQEAKMRRKEEKKRLLEMAKQVPNQGTAKSLGLLDPNFSLPNSNQQHPLTGDLSRFVTTVGKEE